MNYFRVLQGEELLVILEMDFHGNHTVLSAGKSSAEQWPQWEPIAPYWKLWFERWEGQPCPPMGKRKQSVTPGMPDYPRVLAELLSSDKLLNLWAYVSPKDVFISLQQVAHAVNRPPDAELRADLVRRGITITQDGSSRYRVPLAQIMRTFGVEVADRVLLRTGQIGEFLGLTSTATTLAVRRLGIGVARDGETLVAWGIVRRIRRTGPRTLELPPDLTNS